MASFRPFDLAKSLAGLSPTGEMTTSILAGIDPVEQAFASDRRFVPRPLGPTMMPSRSMDTSALMIDRLETL
jgi:hypothetical protein